MKLTLEQLAPYLPYGLKIFDENRAAFKMDFLQMNANGGTGYEAIYNAIQYSMKPILRPMSDFSSIDLIDIFRLAYISFYGADETFEKLDNYIFHGWDEDNFGLTVFDDVFEYGFSVDFQDQKDFRFSYRMKDSRLPNTLLKIDKLYLFMKMYEKHFDVFGLIEAGLAIDINSLNSQP